MTSNCTPIYGLPFAVGTDGMCDAASKLCQLATIVDTTLAGYASELADLTPARPMFKVSRQETPQTLDNTVTGDSVIEWDTIIEDDDNIINLTADSHGAVITRPGIWVFETYVEATAEASGDILALGILLNPNSDASSYDDSLFQDFEWRSSKTPWQRAQMTLDITQNFIASGLQRVVSSITYASGAGGSNLTVVSYAEMTGYWMSTEA